MQLYINLPFIRLDVVNNLLYALSQRYEWEQRSICYKNSLVLPKVGGCVHVLILCYHTWCVASLHTNHKCLFTKLYVFKNRYAELFFSTRTGHALLYCYSLSLDHQSSESCNK